MSPNRSNQLDSPLRSIISFIVIGLVTALFSSCSNLASFQPPRLPDHSQTSTPQEASQSQTSDAKSRVHTITISENLGAATEGKSYNSVLSVSGGFPPYHFFIRNGALPPGLSLNSGTGTISGVPVKRGTFNFTVGVTDKPHFGVDSDASHHSAPRIHRISEIAGERVKRRRRSSYGWKRLHLVVSPPPSTVSTPLTITGNLEGGQVEIPYSGALIAHGGVSPYQWSVGSGALPAGVALNSKTGVVSGTPTKPGTFSFTAKLVDASSHVAAATFSFDVGASTSGNFDGPAELPRNYVQSAMAATPAAGKKILVEQGGDLQGAIDGASCGDTILLRAGSTFSGTFTLLAKNCDNDHWIIIRTSAPDSDLPKENTRLTPCYAGVSGLPLRPAYSCAAAKNVLARIMATGNNAFRTAPGANHYRLIGLEVTHPSGMRPGQPDTLISLLGTPVPHHIIIDRCWIHGRPTDFLKRGVLLDGDNLAVVDSTVTDVHAVSTATQGILSCTANGPLKISNNFVEGGDSAIGFGGGPNRNGNPSDVEITRNHMFKPRSWRYGDSKYLGFQFNAKVALESKNSSRVLIEGNILENSWGGRQGGDGGAVWLGPKNQNNACPNCEVNDITFRYNIIRHAGAGIYIFDALSDAGGLAQQAKRYSIHDNLLDDINESYAGSGTGRAILFRIAGSTRFNPPRDVSIQHNTGLEVGSNSGFLSLDTSPEAPVENLTFKDNLVLQGKYGILGCKARYGKAVLENCTKGLSFTNNVVVGATGGYPESKASPQSRSHYPADVRSVEFVNEKAGPAGYVLCQAKGAPSSSCDRPSPYVKRATDGADIGADINAVILATRNVQ